MTRSKRWLILFTRRIARALWAACNAAEDKHRPTHATAEEAAQALADWEGAIEDMHPDHW